MAPKPLLRSRSHAKKTFGEAFGAATGVSDPGDIIADTHSFIRQAGDKSEWLPSSHAELGLGVPGSAELQLGERSQNGATAT